MITIKWTPIEHVGKWLCAFNNWLRAASETCWHDNLTTMTMKAAAPIIHIDGWVQERSSPSALAMD